MQTLFISFNRIREKHCDGHRSDTAGNRRNIACNFGDFFGVNISAKFSFGIAIHTDINHGGAGFNHISRDDFFFTDRSDNDIGLKSELFQILGFTVRDRDGGIVF